MPRFRRHARDLGSRLRTMVAKQVERFFDERRRRMLRTRNLVALEGVRCDGRGLPETAGCDRGCSSFWRTEWLERVT